MSKRHSREYNVAKKQTEEILKAIRKACPGLEVPKDMPLPVRYDGMRYYWGKDGEMVADFDEGVNTGDGFRIRGWGRIKNEERQDECAKYIERAINAYSEPNLAHLLMTIGTQYAIDGEGYIMHFVDTDYGSDTDSIWVNVTGENGLLKFDLTISVTDNIESNSELREFLYRELVK